MIELYQDTPPSAAKVTRYWSDKQRAFIESPLFFTALWGGNAAGKSQVLAEIAKRGLMGDLHWQQPGRPYVVILTGNTWTQLGQTLKYLFASLPEGMFREGIRYEGGGVKGQRLAVYEVISGPCAGSELRCGTFRASNLAGPRADIVAADEPLPADVQNELLPRLMARNGRMYVTFTPTIATSHKLDHMWRLIDDPAIDWAGEIQVETTLANCTPRGGLVELPWITQAEIDRLQQGVSAIEADMRLGRSRRPRMDTAYFSEWGQHLRQDWKAPDGTLIGIGIDHGSRPGAQRASLVYVSGSSYNARVHVADHAKADGRTEIEQDARNILDMIARNGHRIEDVDLWVGDRSHGGDRWGGVKSNLRLQQAIAQAMGINTERKRHLWIVDLPPALQHMGKPRKYHGSVWDGCESLHRLMVAKRFTISTRPECNALDADFASWQAATTDPAKDGIDSVRYPTIALVDGRQAA
jgi:hypothetical protein